MKNRKILAFDIASTTGWSYMKDSKIIETGHFKYDKTDLSKFFSEIENILISIKPDYVIAASPTRFFNTIFLHGRIFGIFDLVLEDNDLSFWMDVTAKGKPTLPVDSKMKKAVLGKGKASKAEIMEFTGIGQEDEADATMFCMYLDGILKK